MCAISIIQNTRKLRRLSYVLPAKVAFFTLFRISPFFAVLVTVGCACVGGEWKDYTAHVYVLNKMDRPINVNIRVYYQEDERSEVDYRYASDELGGYESKVIQIDTRSFDIWEKQTGGSDCARQSKIDSKEYGHGAEFSLSTLSSYTICRKAQERGKGHEFLIYEFGSTCPDNAFEVDSGW